MSDGAQVTVILRRSAISQTERQRATLRGLGLRRLGDARRLIRTPAVLGMIRKVQHLVEVKD